MPTIAELSRDIHQTAVDKGWWDADRNIGEVLMLIVSEVAEALEEWRNGRSPDEVYYATKINIPLPHLPVRTSEPSTLKPEGFGVELADACIRIFDICYRYNIDLESLIVEKMAYNTTREHRHDGKRA